MEENIRKQILSMAENDYRIFSSSLLPDVQNIVGVRLPKLRKLAKQISKDNWFDYLEIAQQYNKDNLLFVEIMLHGMVVGYINIEIEEILYYVKNFVPKIDNWSICDSFCIGLKFVNQNMTVMWDFLQPYFSSTKTYDVRFAIVILLDFYINETYIQQVLNILDNVKHDSYYVKMAVAWAISVCLVKFQNLTMDYLKNNRLDDFTYNKSLQKITESFRVDKEIKIEIKKMRRSERMCFV